MQTAPFILQIHFLKRHFLLLGCLLLFCACNQNNRKPVLIANKPAPVVIDTIPDYPAIPPSDFATFINTPSRWVDSVFKTMTPDERIAQLMIVEAFSNQGPKYEEDVLHLIKEYKIGGIIWFQGGPVRQANMTNKFQAASKIPLLISMDAESGVGMRLDSTALYPLPMMLGALQNDSLIYQLGREVAAEFKRLGMHMNFAPVADINNNPRNPVISYRAFGEEKHLVSRKSLAYMRGMQDYGIIAVAKHFPGHGDTDVDSHYDLPLIQHTRERLDSVELFPFRELIMAGVGGIMVAHMDIPSLDSVVNLPSSLSEPVVSGLLKQEMGYQGLIITDAMVMHGVTKHFKPGEGEVLALQAGNDILERMVSVPKAIAAIKAAIRAGKLSQKEIDRRCKRVLAAKLWLGLDKYQPIQTDSLFQDLNPKIADELNRFIAREAVTLVEAKKRALPVKSSKMLRRHKIATVSFGSSSRTAFQKQVALHAPNTDHFVLPRKSKPGAVATLRNKLRKYDVVLAGIYGPSERPSNNLGYTKAETKLISDLAVAGKTIFTLFDNPYALSQFPGIEKSRAVLVGYQRLQASQEVAADIIFGERQAKGTLPVTIQYSNK